MIHLYQAGGAGDFTILQDGLSHDQCRVLFENAARLLTAAPKCGVQESYSRCPSG